MAPTRAKTESGSNRSCLEVLSASGYVWGVTDDEHVENRVVRDDGFERHFDFLKVLSMCMIAAR